MAIQISGSTLTTGINNTVQSPPYGSLSFNGINQSIVTSGTGSGANGTVLDITTGSPSWTVECWIYTSQLSRQDVPQIPLNKGNGQTLDIRVISGNNSYVTFGTNFLQVQFYSTTLGWIYMNSWPTTMSLNTWYHVAVCKDTTNGNRYYLYLNGVLVSSTPDIVNSAANNGQPFEFGMAIAETGSAQEYAFNGLLSNIRIVKGAALYVPPIASEPSLPLTSTQSLNLSGYNQAITGTQTSLLLTTPNNASYLTDTSSYAQTVTGVNTPTSSALGPSTYSGSILFNGTNQYLSIAAAAQFNYSTNDFTWEMWIYPTAATWTSGTFYLIDHGPQTVNQGLLHYSGNKLMYYNYYNAGNIPPYTAGVVYPSLYTIGGGTIPANTWTHVAVCRQNLVTNMFVNGQVVSSGPDPYNYATLSGAPSSNPIISPATQSVSIGARIDGALPFKGNISNVRIVNGVSVYNVGNFTPPVQPLPAVQAPNVIGSPSKAISSNQTSLLVSTPYTTSFLKDGSFNNVTLTQQTVGSFPPSTYTLTSNSTNPFNSNGSTFTPGSIFFNGSSQYLSVASSPTLALSTGDFTVECWVNWSSLTTSSIIDNQSSGGFCLYYDAGVYISNYLVVSNRIVNQLTYPWTPALNTWYHIAISRLGTNLRMFINGVLVTSTDSDTTDYQAGIYQIGADLGTGAGGWYLNGYLSNLRIIKGAAVYTQSFIPTSGPFTTSQTFNQSGIPSCPVQSSQTELLLTTPSNSSYLTDSSTNAFTVTNVGTATSNPFNPFSENYTILANPGSVQLNGSTQYLTVSNNTSLDMASGDFTVELWFNPSTTSGAIFTKRNSNINYSPIQLIWGSSQFTVYISTTGSSWAVSSVTTGSYLTGNWYHVALVRSSNLIYLYVNGVSSITPVAVSGSLMTNADSFVVGADAASGPGSVFNGYISNFRIVKGVAVYTSAFTPPAAPLNNSQVANQSGAPSAAVTVSQTSLLLNTAFGTNFTVDSSINNFTVTNNGTATSATLDPFVF
jgi:hypothetical protein